MRPTRAAERQTVHSFQQTISRAIGYKYLLSVPTGYEPTGERRWPLLLFLHGSGERGDDVWSAAEHGPPKLLREAGRDGRRPGAASSAARMLAEQFIVVSPQCPKHKWWETEILLALLDAVMAAHRVDPLRVYVTGMSMGGYGAWDLATTHPDRFAALAPVCGGGQFASLFMSDIHKRDDLRRLAVWAFHGARDTAVPPNESQRMVDAMKHYQAREVKLTMYPHAEHDAWTETYANPELYAWLLRQARRKPRRRT